MNSKAIRKQLLAAVAMVLVALISLSSATFAWFVTNNTVKATTSTISAQSNAAFMVIKYGESAVSSDLTADKATIDDTPLYPAQWAKNFNVDGANGAAITVDKPAVYQFETAYAQTVGAATMKADTLVAVGDPAAAVSAEYAVKNTFNISAKGTNLTALKVAGASIATGDTGNTELDNALRVLVVSPTGWVLCDKDGVVSDSDGANNGTLGDTITAGADTEVNLYVYYDGNEDEIYTNNLANLKDASAKITVEFTATADNH